MEKLIVLLTNLLLAGRVPEVRAHLQLYFRSDTESIPQRHRAVTINRAISSTKTGNYARIAAPLGAAQ